MGYVMAMGTCVGCSKIFSFNPKYVPSIRLNAQRQPICRACIEIINPKRVANGLDPVVPHPDAYGALPEEELE